MPQCETISFGESVRTARGALNGLRGSILPPLMDGRRCAASAKAAGTRGRGRTGVARRGGISSITKMDASLRFLDGDAAVAVASSRFSAPPPIQRPIVRNPAVCRWQMSLRISVFLWLMRRHRRPYDISYRGKTIRIFPGVFSPRYDWSAKFAVDCLPALAGKSFLEVGAGCGISRSSRLKAEPELVVSVDISPIPRETSPSISALAGCRMRMSFKGTCSRRFRASLISSSSTPPITESARRIGWREP